LTAKFLINPFTWWQGIKGRRKFALTPPLPSRERHFISYYAEDYNLRLTSL
jgi:hypothetical protein